MTRPTRILLSVILAAVSNGCSNDDNPTKPPTGSTWGTPGAPQNVTAFPSRNPDVSPDNTKLAMELTSGGIAVVPIAGGATDTLVTAFVVGPDWSPDGTKIVVDEGGALGLIDVATKGASTLGSGDVDGNPAWSPDGSKIAARKTSGGDGIGITTYPAGTWSVLPCVNPNGGDCAGEGPTWSPDGTAIAFEAGLEIQRVPSGGGTATVVVEGVGDDVTRPSWSPSGQWIAFEAESLGASIDSYEHIWIADSRGKQYGLHQITFGPHFDTEPSWSQDSGTIYFTSDRGGSFEIWKVVIQP